MLTFHGVVKIAPDSFLQAYVLVSFTSLKNLTSILIVKLSFTHSSLLSSVYNLHTKPVDILGALGPYTALILPMHTKLEEDFR